ncbi:hypothetical protein W97_04609 [Coniosporium apollinis CBS 100218]|uniref:Rab-GAP TBC domain-containing protein n=1 Tax=Coniosporium apollinis (strain CBS 100218) TaxID=1168221 RepID=R7YUK6_CONA1|nr:uncharacterized protein W97_04609 [Coniosporium apollinis CBS 100218]EON65371.1 hypothetical protein W97_04609 [Coniosporium apollinis CBS 100218]
MTASQHEREPQCVGNGDGSCLGRKLHIDTALAQTHVATTDLDRISPASSHPRSPATSVSSKASSAAPIRPIHPDHMLGGGFGGTNWDTAPESSGRHKPIPMPLPYLPLRKQSTQRLRQKHSPLNEGRFPKAEQSSPKLPLAGGLVSERAAIALNDSEGVTNSALPKPALPAHENADSPTRFPPRKSSLHRERGASLSSHDSSAEQQPSLPLRAAISIPDLSSTRSKKEHGEPTPNHPDRATCPGDTSRSPLEWHPLPPLEAPPDEVRASIRSAETYGSSGFIDASETERSSVVTSHSFNEDLCGGFTHYEGSDSEGMSVEDAIGMYADGFGDDDNDQPVDKVRAPSDEGYFSQIHLSSGADAETPLAEPRGRSTSRMESGCFKADTLPKEDARQVIPQCVRNSTETISKHRTSTTPNLVKTAGPVPRDRYGFKKITTYITEEHYDAWNGPYTDYLGRRRKKWEQLMKQHHLPTENPTKFPPKSDKIKRYIRKGIPPEWRGAAWFWYAGGPARLARNEGLYWELIEQVTQGKLKDQDGEHIERDLHRSFPDNIRFKPDPVSARDSAVTGVDSHHSSFEPETAILRSLRRVLQAFAIHNPHIGYCQSLNFLAGLLLIFLDEDEEKAFIMLNIITNEHLPGSHARVLEANVDIGVLMSCIQESMPAIWAKIDDVAETAATTSYRGHISVSKARLPTVSLATTAWFMSCFVGNLPIETVLRVWDSFFYEGSKTLFRIALAVFKMGELDIRAVNDHMEIFQVVQNIPRRLIDANALMETCFKRRNGFGHLSQEIIDMRRADRRRAHKEDVARLNGATTMPMSVEKPSGTRRAASRARFKRGISRRRPTEA